MASFCLPKELTQSFLQALKSGELDPAKLSGPGIESAARRAEFAKIVGEDNAKEVNALFESKLLLKDQQAGIIRWIKAVGGLTPEVEKSFVAKITKMENILTPEEEQSFLSDLAAKKLGTEVTPDEATHISELAQKATLAQKSLTPDRVWGDPAAQEYGLAFQDLKDYVEGLKPGPSGWKYWGAQIANLPRTALVSILHFSAPFVQGWG